uniref:Tudor domain-containing protein n=1 Tax=Romanomermis culicivorax TaxID=13658 RepID=A0A915IBH9_ROMCU
MQSRVEAVRQIMSEFYNSTNSDDYMIPDQLLKPNIICAANVDNTWHRVQIKDVVQKDLYSAIALGNGAQ